MALKCHFLVLNVLSFKRGDPYNLGKFNARDIKCTICLKDKPNRLHLYLHDGIHNKVNFPKPPPACAVLWVPLRSCVQLKISRHILCTIKCIFGSCSACSNTGKVSFLVLKCSLLTRECQYFSSGHP